MVENRVTTEPRFSAKVYSHAKSWQSRTAFEWAEKLTNINTYSKNDAAFPLARSAAFSRGKERQDVQRVCAEVIPASA